MTPCTAVGIDLGGTTLTAVVIDREGKRLGVRTAPTLVDRGPDAVIDDMTGLVDAVLSDASLNRSVLCGIGVGAPGPLSPRTGRIIRSANLPGWIDLPICDRLQDKLDVRITLDNDGNAAAFGESWLGAGKDGSDLVMLTLGTGVGAGIVLNGKLLQGHFENAAELGHMIVVLDGLPCTCGQRGCLEQYASAGAVARRVTSGIEMGEACSLSPPVDAESVVAHAKEGDALCLRIWNEACAYLSVACINIQHTFNPRRIVLGGGMGEAGAFLLDGVTKELDRRRWNLHDDVPSIVLAELGREAGAIGAAGLALQTAAETGASTP